MGQADLSATLRRHPQSFFRADRRSALLFPNRRWADLMCNLYSLNRPQDEIRRWFDVSRDSAGNLPPMPGIFPDQMAPVVLAGKQGRELTMMRWGKAGYASNIFQCPPSALLVPSTSHRLTMSALSWSSLPGRMMWASCAVSS